MNRGTYRSKVASVTRYVITHIGKTGMRTLALGAQGRFTYATQELAQKQLDAMMSASDIERLRELYGLPLEVRPVECYPGHFDPMTIWFEADFSVSGEGSVYLLTPNTPRAEAWAAEHLPSDAQTLGRGIAVEHRYIADIVAGIQRDGLSVE